MHHDLVDLPRWGFASPGRIRDELTALALAGRKTATTGLLVELELEGEPVPVAGERSVLVDSAGQPVAIVETVGCRVIRLADVDDRHAIDEGEGYANAAEFRAEHERFWNGYLHELRRGLGDPSFTITDDTLVTAERIRVVARLDTPAGPVDVRAAGPDAVPALAAVLGRAFGQDPLVTWPMGGGADLPARIRAMFEDVDTDYASEGWVVAAADGLGVMTLLPPGGGAREAELAAAAAPRLAALFEDGGARYDALWAWIGAMLPGEPHWLLDQLAVEPAAQGRGIGGALLRHAVDVAAAGGRPLVLETATERTLALYRRFGFEVYADGVAPGGGPRTWFLRRDPGAAS